MEGREGKMFFYKDIYHDGKFFLKKSDDPLEMNDPNTKDNLKETKINLEDSKSKSSLDGPVRGKRSISDFQPDEEIDLLLTIPPSEFKSDVNFPSIITPTESMSNVASALLKKAHNEMDNKEETEGNLLKISKEKPVNASSAPPQSSFLKIDDNQIELKREIDSMATTIEEADGDNDDDIGEGHHAQFNEDRVAKKLIRDLFVYILFVICAGVIEFSMSSRSAVYFTNTMDAAFMETPYYRPEKFTTNDEYKEPMTAEKRNLNVSKNIFRDRPEGGIAGGTSTGSSTQTLKKSKTIEEFWDFAETTFINMMYWQFWYSYENPVIPTLPDDQLIFYSSKLLGVARIRQLRVKTDSCEIHAQASHLFNVCYGYYDSDVEDKMPLPDISPVQYTGTGWRHSQLKNTLSYSGKFSTYGGDGYYVDMSLNKTLSELRVHELKSNLWIDRGTRVVIIDFTVYNTNVNLFVVTKIVIEIPPTGGIYPTGEFYTLKLLRYVSIQDFVVLGFEFAFIFFIFYYIITTILLIKNAKTKYFTNVWNILDIIIVLFGVTVVICGIYRYFAIEKNVIELMKVIEEHPSFDKPRYFQIIFNETSTIVLFFIWIKLFKYLQFNQTINELNKTLAKSTKGILSFTIMFCIIFFAFAQFAYLIFGTEVEDYRSVWSSAMSLLQAVLGKLNYRELEESNFILGPLFLIFFVFFIFFVLMNMFGAIIIESYKTVRSQISPARERLVGTYLTRVFTNIFTKSRSNTTDSDKSITYSKIRDSLHRAGFTDMEIDVFFAKYNIKQDFDVTQAEAKKLIAKLELRKFDFDPINLNAQTVAILQKEFEKMKSYVEDLEKKVEIQNQQLRSHYIENHKVGSTQTPAWTSF